MWLTNLANSAFGGAFVAAAALLWQQSRERKDAAGKELRDHQRDQHATWREERKIAHTQALSALHEVWGVATNEYLKMMIQQIKSQQAGVKNQNLELLIMAQEQEPEKIGRDFLRERI